MKHRRRTHLWTLFAALALGLVVLPTVMASATVGTMEVAVDTTLTEDHNGRIEITADNVTLDCAGHKVVGPAAPSGSIIGIQVHFRSGVTVRNCDVSGFVIGISLHDTDGSTVEDNTLHDNVTGDVPVGMSLNGSSDNVIEDNVANGNSGDGIAVQVSAGDSTGNTFDGNTLTDNGRFGFVLAGATGNTIRNNVAKRNTYGFSLEDGAKTNTLSNNLTQDNDEFGFRIEDSGNNTLESNQSVDNGETGFLVSGSSLSNVLLSNEAHRNGWWGFEDETTGGEGILGTTTTYSKNRCTGNENGGSKPMGLCQEEPVGLVNPSSGEWHLRHSENSVVSFYYGNPGDVPFMGDWDCDTVATPGLFRQSDAYAYLRNSNTQGIADIRFFFGNPSDIPLAGDFNGDGCDTLSIYRPSEARFYIINKLGENEGGLGAAEYSFLFGNPGDKPVVGDWDGDGIDEIGLHRETTGFFYYRNTLTTGIADGQFFFGDPGDRFVSGDWGVVDGVDTPAMFRPSNSTFYFRHTLTQGNADSEFVWPGAGTGWLPVSGDFTLD